MNAHRMYATEIRRRLPAHFFQPVPHRALWIIPYATVIAGGIAAIIAGNLPLLAKIGFSLLIGLAIG